MVAVAVVPCSQATAYEFRTHHGMTVAARDFLRHHPELYENDPDFRRFIEEPGGEYHGFGDLIDSRAGDPYEGAWVDEDHEEGRLGRAAWDDGRGSFCRYEETPCVMFDGVWCTLDHFHPRLFAIPGKEDAFRHARRYFDWAVTLYRTAKCTSIGPRRQELFRAAAKALGDGPWPGCRGGGA